jgi:GrpB-like predicted nucleotidyltransferase (UPF0157 family)
MPAILLVDYDPAWPQLYEKEKALVLRVLGHYVSAIEHVGSTSVPGLGGRPTLDLLVGLPHFSLAERCVEPLQRIGYGFQGESGIPQRYFFRKPDTSTWADRTHTVHMVEEGSPEWQRMLRFRDYLHTHPEEARAYYQLKTELAAEYDTDPLAYPLAKMEFISSMLAKAELELRG